MLSKQKAKFEKSGLHGITGVKKTDWTRLVVGPICAVRLLSVTIDEPVLLRFLLQAVQLQLV